MNLGAAGEIRSARSSFLKELNTDCNPSKAELFLDFEKNILNKFKSALDYK